MSRTLIPTRTTAMITVYAYARCPIEVTTPQPLRLDRMTYAESGGFASVRHGGLVPAGTSTLALTAGVYHFPVGRDVQLAFVDDGAIDVVAALVDDADCDLGVTPRSNSAEAFSFSTYETVDGVPVMVFTYRSDTPGR